MFTLESLAVVSVFGFVSGVVFDCSITSFWRISENVVEAGRLQSVKAKRCVCSMRNV